MPIHSSLEGLDEAALTLALEGELASARGDTATAVRLLGHAMDVQLRLDGKMPHSLVGRLAVLYRRSRRHDEEVALLLRFQELHDSEPSAMRYNARLTKAMALAERRRRVETGALQWVRHIVDDRRNGRACEALPI